MGASPVADCETFRLAPTGRGITGGSNGSQVKCRSHLTGTEAPKARYVRWLRHLRYLGRQGSGTPGDRLTGQVHVIEFPQV